jgi:hypothetical protein
MKKDNMLKNIWNICCEIGPCGQSQKAGTETFGEMEIMQFLKF